MHSPHDQALAAGLNLALNAAGGNQSELARVCGCTVGAVWQMLHKAKPALSVPFVLKVEAALGIPRHILRPDFYPPPESEVAQVHAQAA